MKRLNFLGTLILGLSIGHTPVVAGDGAGISCNNDLFSVTITRDGGFEYDATGLGGDLVVDDSPVEVQMDRMKRWKALRSMPPVSVTLQDPPSQTDCRRALQELQRAYLNALKNSSA